MERRLCFLHRKCPRGRRSPLLTCYILPTSLQLILILFLLLDVCRFRVLGWDCLYSPFPKLNAACIFAEGLRYEYMRIGEVDEMRVTYGMCSCASCPCFRILWVEFGSLIHGFKLNREITYPFMDSHLLRIRSSIQIPKS